MCQAKKDKRTQHRFYGVPAKSAWPESNSQKTSEKPQIRDILQNNWCSGREGEKKRGKEVKTLKDELPRDYSRLKRLKRHGIQMLHIIQDQKLFWGGYKAQ